MTDDERMDRARRIREMREGSRSDDDEASPGEEPEAADTPEEGATADSADAGGAADSDAGGAADSDAGGAADSGDAAGSATGADADGGGTMHIPGADVGDVDVDVEEMARQAGLSTVEDSAAGDGEDGDGGESAEAADAGGVGPAGIGADESVSMATAADETRVLEFGLGDEKYCLDIEYIEEIVKRETITRVPNTPDYVEGVVDLRGQITTILDPKVPLDIDASGSKDLLVVFDPEAFEEQGAIGWVVDDVNQVMPIADDEVNESPMDDDHINGVVDRDGEFVIWASPEVALEEASG